MIKSTIVQQTAVHLQRELNRLESEKEKVRKALAAVQAIFGTGEGLRAARHPRRNSKQPTAKPTAKAQYRGKIEKTCPLCHEDFMAWRKDQIFCGRRSSCKSNRRGAIAWRAKQQAKADAKAEKKGTTLLPGDPLRPGANA